MDEPVSARCNCASLRQASRHVTRLYDDALAPAGLGLNQYSILARLDRLGAPTLQGLADNLVMDRSTLGHLVRPLEARGLLAIKPSERDRRSRILVLTDEGRALLDRARPLWAQAQRAFDQAYGHQQASILRDALAAVQMLAFEHTASPRTPQT